MNGVMDLFNSLYLVCNPFDKIIRLLLLYTWSFFKSYKIYDLEIILKNSTKI
jgi:hypothetical protein